MAMSKRGFVGFFFKRERFSIDELRYLCDQLAKTTVITDSNRDMVVETLRSISELMIWGDQHEASFFDFFLERQVLGNFLRIISHPGNRRGGVAVQMLQTLSIMIQNIKSETALYYLFSNNHINDLIEYRFDFADEELLAYYISFLKTISLKLNERTVHFFFRRNAEGRASFPLYTEAIKLLRHSESMVRVAVRTLTLNIYSVKDPALVKFIVGHPQVNYFSEVVQYVRAQCFALDDLLHSGSRGRDKGAIEGAVAEVLDLFHYITDILRLDVPEYCEVMTVSLLDSFIRPLLIASLAPPDPSNMPKTPPIDIVKHISESGGAFGNLGDDDKSPTKRELGGIWQEDGCISPLLATFLLSRLITAIRYGPILDAIAGALAVRSNSQLLRRAASVNELANSAAGKDSVELPGLRSLTSLRVTPKNFRAALLEEILSENEKFSQAALCVLISLMKSKEISEAMLDAAGLLPQRQRHRALLLNALTGVATEDDLESVLSSRTGVPPQAAQLADSSAEGREGETSAPGAGEGEGNGNGTRVEVEERAGEGGEAELDRGAPGAASAADGVGNSIEVGFKVIEAATGGDGGDRGGGGKLAVEGVSLGAGVRALSIYEHGDYFPPDVCMENRTEVTEFLVALVSQSKPPSAPVLWCAGWLLRNLVEPAGSRSGGGGGGGKSDANGVDSGGDDTGLPTAGGKASLVAKAGSILSSSPAIQPVYRAYESARSRVYYELCDVWADVVATVIGEEWVLCRRNMGVPVFRIDSATILLPPAPSAVYDDKSSAAVAERTVANIKAFVALHQLRCWLLEGSVPEQAPILPPPKLQPVEGVITSAAEEAVALVEGSELMLAGLTALPCRVAFERGRERTVYLVPVLRASPAPLIVLAEPSPSRLGAGVVRAMAPVAAAQVTIDKAHPKWLHLVVRSPLPQRDQSNEVSGNNVFSGSRKRLTDGRWTVAFNDEELCTTAKRTVDAGLAIVRANFQAAFDEAFPPPSPEGATVPEPPSESFLSPNEDAPLILSG